ncbi:MAG: FtsW/RodA/SpoVE family cell cycle protein [Lachnospiraceae bacterium]|nr:FtsW/RodA/SpoVE family cell cycle protein [Lachnospiraceae bacterium]
MFHNYKFKNYNLPLVIAVVALTIIGIMIIGSANSDNQSKQIVGMIVGVILMFIVSLVDFEFLLRFHWVYYVLTILLLLSVLLLGDSSLGAKRWINVGIRFQPSEISKIFLVLFFAWYFTHFMESLNTRKRLILTLVYIGIPLLLILKEPDLSTTIVTLMVVVTMFYAAGLTSKVVVPVLSISIPAIVVFILYSMQTGTVPFIKGYQKKRILAWLRPNDYPQSSYQQQNSIMAIGSGQLLGKGLNNNDWNSVKNGNYISEPHTDFIFAVAGEEIGFIGSCILILLMLFIVIQCLRIAKRAKNDAGKLICIGIASIIGFQSFVNICVVTGLMPNTGLTLPFVSYGLTSLVTIYIGIGLVLNVGLQAKKFYER